MELAEKVAQLPTQAGVYLFKNVLGTVLYVGKARSLRSRVKSYFLESRWVDAKTGSLVREIADLDYIVVDNEREALALENNLIKQHKPKFNVLLRDDKTYPYIRYTAFEKYPRVYVTRRLKKTARSTSGRFSRTAWRTGSFTSSTRISASPPAPWTSRAITRAPACSTTFTAAWGHASPGSPPMSGMPRPSATPECFSKAAAATSWPA